MADTFRVGYAFSQKLIPQVFQDAGYAPVFLDGYNFSPASIDQADKQLLRRGLLFDKNGDVASFYAIRSGDLMERVKLGKLDVILIGKDHYYNHHLKEDNTRILGTLPHARTSVDVAKVEAWVTQDCPLQSLDDINSSYVIRAEIQNYAARIMEEKGHKVLVRELNDETDPVGFRMQAKEGGAIPIEFVRGGLPQSLEQDEVGLVVSETGGTLKRNDCRSLGVVCTVEQLVVANLESLNNPEMGARLRKFNEDLINHHHEKEFEGNGIHGERA